MHVDVLASTEFVYTPIRKYGDTPIPVYTFFNLIYNCKQYLKKSKTKRRN